MNQDIRNGAEQLFRGLKTEAKDVKDKFIASLDADKDGKIEFAEVEEETIRCAKEGVEKLKSLAADDKIAKKTKAEVEEALSKIKPLVEALKMETEIAKEKVEAEIAYDKEVEAKKDEIL